MTGGCEAVETTQVSPPLVTAGPTPHIFETWLHSFWVTSLYTCPLHLTHFNHQMTCQSHYTKSPAWCSGRTSAPTGQRGYGGRLLHSNSFWFGELWVRAVMVVHADGLAFHQITSCRDQFHLCNVCLSHSGLIPQMGNWFAAWKEMGTRVELR